jgi:hypothetical protein
VPVALPVLSLIAVSEPHIGIVVKCAAYLPAINGNTI